MQGKKKLIAFLAFAMYFLTGAACIVVGSSLPHLVKLYNMDLEKVVLLGSAYAMGRLSTVYFTGRMVEKFGPMKVLAGGVLMVTAFLFGIPTIVNYYAGMCFAFLGGIGMGAQDTVCPLLLSMVAKENYAGSLSAGQALFGLESFATPFLVGILLSNSLPFYYAYYILLIVPVVMLILIPFVKLDEKENSQAQEENVKPLYVKRSSVAYIAIFVVCAAYSAVVNTLGLYISSFAEGIGISPAISAFMLTVYNIGCVCGSFLFVVVLKKVSVQLVLLGNFVLSGVALLISMMVNRVETYFICFFVAGFFLGVLFSVIVTIATRIGYKRISVASSLVATASGASDIFTPIVTGIVVSALGIHVSIGYAILMIAISILATVVLWINTTEKKTVDE